MWSLTFLGWKIWWINLSVTCPDSTWVLLLVRDIVPPGRDRGECFSPKHIVSYGFCLIKSRAMQPQPHWSNRCFLVHVAIGRLISASSPNALSSLAPEHFLWEFICPCFRPSCSLSSSLSIWKGICVCERLCSQLGTKKNQKPWACNSQASNKCASITKIFAHLSSDPGYLFPRPRGYLLSSTLSPSPAAAILPTDTCRCQSVAFSQHLPTLQLWFLAFFLHCTFFRKFTLSGIFSPFYNGLEIL